MNGSDKFDVHGKPLSSRDIARGLKISVAAGFFGMWWWAVAAGVPTTMLLECLGGCGIVIGLVVALQQFAMLMQVPSALFFEKMPRRKRLWGVLAVAMRLLWLVPAFAPLIFGTDPNTAIVLILCSIGLSFMIGHFCSPIWQNWMADLIPPDLSGKFWGVRQSVVTVSFLASTVAMGLILDYYSHPRREDGSYAGFAIVFTIAAIAGIIDIVTHLFVPEPAHESYQTSPNVFGRIIAPLKNADYRHMTVAFAVWYFAVGLIGSFAIVYLKRSVEANYLHLAMLVVSSSTGPVLFGILGGFLIDKIGARIFTVVLFAASSLTLLVWFFVSNDLITLDLPLLKPLTVPQPVLLLFAANFVGGVINGWLAISQFHLVNVMSPKEGRGMAIAAHWSVVGLLSAAGPLAGGMIMDYYSRHPLPYALPTGVPFSYLHLLVTIHIGLLFMVCIPLTLTIKSGKAKTTLAEVFKGIRLGNPLRAAIVVYGIYTSAFNLESSTKSEDEN